MAPAYSNPSTPLFSRKPTRAQDSTKVPPELVPNPAPAVLLSLPNELLLIIGNNLSFKDLYSLSQVHHRLLLLFTPAENDTTLIRSSFHEQLPFQRLRVVQYYLQLPFDRLPKLHSAALKGQHQVLQDLLDDPKWPDVNERATDFQGKTPLYFAAVAGHEHIVRLLLDRGATINTAGEIRYGKSALHMAASGGHEGTVKLLLKRGADAFYEDYKARTPLLWAARSAPSGKELVGVFQLLLASGARVNSSDIDYGASVLHWAAVKGRKETVKLLLEKGASVTAPNLGIKTAVNWASRSGDEEMIKILTERIGYEPDGSKGRGIINWVKRLKSLQL